jgi:prepilin-type N-terminal cleavage/methylation domain-containing protein/prepilin-type processing-associated H-X9-DG protein
MRQQRLRRERGFTSAVSVRAGFTLVELLVVIGIIALLISILLPALSRARETANTVKCASNLRSVGQGMAQYLANNKNTYPAAYIYEGMQIQGAAPSGTQLPPAADKGYVHWSAMIYNRKDTAANDSIFRQLSGWEMFTCPSIDKGGLPATNTFPGNNDALPNDAPSVVDKMAPRCAFTVNEAICPRNKFCYTFQGAVRVYSFVRGGRIRNSGATILATELSREASLVAGTGEVSGSSVCKSHRPVHGFFSPASGQLDMSLVPKSLTGLASLYRVTKDQLNSDPEVNLVTGSASQTRLDWVGRNHGPKKLVNGVDKRKTNFLYVDGHVETKTIYETLDKGFEWGEQFYSLVPGNDIKK